MNTNENETQGERFKGRKKDRLVAETGFVFYKRVIAVVNEQSNNRGSRLIRFTSVSIDPP